MDSSFLDLNNNFTFDAGTEKRQRYDLAEAIEGPKLKDAAGKDKDGWRVLAFADADLFADALVIRAAPVRATLVMVAQIGVGAVARRLRSTGSGGEEVYSGDVVSEKTTSRSSTRRARTRPGSR